jgi:hypothetical protein
MAAITNNVSTEVLERLARLATERGTSVGALLATLARRTPTGGGWEVRQVRPASSYLRELLCPRRTEADVVEGRCALAHIGDV